MKGTITRRGKSSWRIKYDLPPGDDGVRRIAYVTVKGAKKAAERVLRAKLSAIDAGHPRRPVQAHGWRVS